MQKMRQGDYFQISFFKKRYIYIRYEQVVSTLALIYFGRPPLRHTTKTNPITFEMVDLETYSILTFYKKVCD